MNLSRGCGERVPESEVVIRAVPPHAQEDAT
jgi:hypothetical protein